MDGTALSIIRILMFAVVAFVNLLTCYGGIFAIFLPDIDLSKLNNFVNYGFVNLRTYVDRAAATTG